MAYHNTLPGERLLQLCREYVYNITLDVYSHAFRCFESVPVLLFVAVLILVFGQDHPAGKWSQRHTLPATAIAIAKGHHVHTDHDEIQIMDAKKTEKGLEDGVEVHILDVDEDLRRNIRSTVDIAVNESLTFKTAAEILGNPLTWLPALAYLTTFGLELAIDGQMANVLFGLFAKQIKGFNQNKAGYYTSIL